MEDILLKLGLKAGHLITGLIAGIMGLVFNNRPRSFRQKIRSYFVVVSGAILTGYLTPLVLLKWTFLNGAEYSIAFVVGLFGMGLVESIFVLLNKLKDNPIEVGKALKDLFKR